MRLIDADALIDLYKDSVGYSVPVGVIIANIEDAPTIEPEQRWIPCSERLPEEDKDVLITVYFMGLKQTHSNGRNNYIKPSYYVEIARHIDGEWSSTSDESKVGWSRHKVIAWMPLPEPYREEGEE